ncbi:cbb3-type cytochrome c oxidase subunit I [Ilumatobacter coccineus]|uniref:Putative cytochrome c oxidase subunit I n=1 Tax=Ilumatobacter coccineus (strain NBRC 103263 / KCTC 29153 / YM16-304) TaxID=1313172 RepID=A0A6C7EGS6_ILUCY|nr:cbb3-type cytochrome c oxidase subunit I [Ilumatobacter coccineus]BAN04185.1 putative cytochrome c oxidase subunit I [Ilumatobacter coccineus YM16-304]
MTTIDSSPDTAASSSTIGRLLAADVDWLTSTDHKKIGRLFIGGGLLGLLATIAVNLLIAIERVDGDNAALDVDAWSQLLSSQRVGLVFGAALPLAAGLAIAVMPLQLGARAIAFPRLVASGFYMWFGGLVLSIVALAGNGGFSGGDADMVDLFLAAHGLMAIGFAAVGGSLVTSVLTTRAPGMTMRRVPFFSWSTMVFGLSLVLVMPVLFGTIIYLFVDHRSGAREAFDGNFGITTWAGWMFTQPTTFLVAIPALGVFAELLPATFKKRTPLRGIVFAGLSLVGVSALAGVTQQLAFDVPWRGSQLYLGGREDVKEKLYDVLPWAMFHGLPILGAGILVLMALFLAKPSKDENGDTIRPNIGAGFVFAFFGYGMILVGMHGSALEPLTDLDLAGTVFNEASLVYVVYGTALGVMGGLVHWAPKLWGRTLDMKLVAPLALLGVAGTVLASLPHYIAGFLDQPSGLGYSDSDLQIWNILVLVGHALVALSVLAFAGLLAKTVLGADDTDEGPGDDPFDGHTIEWATTSPAPTNNFADVPMITSAEPLLDKKQANAKESV